MDTTVYRCGYCKLALWGPELALTRDMGCPGCGQNRYSPAVLVEDEEMLGLIQRGFPYDEKNFVYIDDSLRKRGILPEGKPWIIREGAE